MMKKRPADFDPFGWLETFFSARVLHRIIRGGIIVILLIFLVHRIRSYSLYWFKPLWVVESLLFVVFLVSYAIRTDPVERSHGMSEILIPLVGGMMPFGLLLSPPHSWITGSLAAAYVVFIWMTAATGFTLWGLWALKRSFSITVEAREPVSSGPYRFVRHPIYLGEILTAAAVLVWRFSAVNVALLIVFVGIQLYRARMEERKLARYFSQYRDFAGRSWWLWKDAS